MLRSAASRNLSAAWRLRSGVARRRADEIVALIGPNGAGKTNSSHASPASRSRMAAACGFLDEFHRAAAASHCEHGIARTFQIAQPFARLSVLENVMVGAYHTTPRRREAADRAEEVARQLGLGPQLDVAPPLTRPDANASSWRARWRRDRSCCCSTSHGWAQPGRGRRDRPHGAGDPSTGVAILLIEHVMQAVVSLAHRVYVLNNGRIIANGRRRDRGRPRVIEAYLGHGAAGRLNTGPRC